MSLDSIKLIKPYIALLTFVSGITAVYALNEREHAKYDAKIIFAEQELSEMKKDIKDLTSMIYQQTILLSKVSGQLKELSHYSRSNEYYNGAKNE